MSLFGKLGAAMVRRKYTKGGSKPSSTYVHHYDGSELDASRRARGHNPTINHHQYPKGHEIHYHPVQMMTTMQSDFKQHPVRVMHEAHPYLDHAKHQMHGERLNTELGKGLRVSHAILHTPGTKPRTLIDTDHYIAHHFPEHHALWTSTAPHKQTELHKQLYHLVQKGHDVHDIHILGPESSTHTGRYHPVAPVMPLYHDPHLSPGTATHFTSAAPHQQQHHQQQHYQQQQHQQQQHHHAQEVYAFSKKVDIPSSMDESKLIGLVHQHYGGKKHFDSLPSDIQIKAITMMKGGKVITHYHEVNPLRTNQRHLSQITNSKNAHYIQHIGHDHGNLNKHKNNDQRREFHKLQVQFLQQGHSMGPAQHIHGAQLAEAHPHTAVGNMSKNHLVAEHKPLHDASGARVTALTGPALVQAYKKHYGDHRDKLNDDHHQLVMQHLKKGELVTHIHRFQRLSENIPDVENHYIKHFNSNKHGKNISDAMIMNHLRQKRAYKNTKMLISTPTTTATTTTVGSPSGSLAWQKGIVPGSREGAINFSKPDTYNVFNLPSNTTWAKQQHQSKQPLNADHQLVKSLQHKHVMYKNNKGQNTTGLVTQVHTAQTKKGGGHTVEKLTVRPLKPDGTVHVKEEEVFLDKIHKTKDGRVETIQNQHMKWLTKNKNVYVHDASKQLVQAKAVWDDKTGHLKHLAVHRNGKATGEKIPFKNVGVVMSDDTILHVGPGGRLTKAPSVKYHTGLKKLADNVKKNGGAKLFPYEHIDISEHGPNTRKTLINSFLKGLDHRAGFENTPNEKKRLLKHDVHVNLAKNQYINSIGQGKLLKSAAALYHKPEVEEDFKKNPAKAFQKHYPQIHDGTPEGNRLIEVHKNMLRNMFPAAFRGKGVRIHDGLVTLGRQGLIVNAGHFMARPPPGVQERASNIAWGLFDYFSPSLQDTANTGPKLVKNYPVYQPGRETNKPRTNAVRYNATGTIPDIGKQTAQLEALRRARRPPK